MRDLAASDRKSLDILQAQERITNAGLAQRINLSASASFNIAMFVRQLGNGTGLAKAGRKSVREPRNRMRRPRMHAIAKRDHSAENRDILPRR